MARDRDVRTRLLYGAPDPAVYSDSSPCRRPHYQGGMYRDRTFRHRCRAFRGLDVCARRGLEFPVYRGHVTVAQSVSIGGKGQDTRRDQFLRVRHDDDLIVLFGRTGYDSGLEAAELRVAAPGCGDRPRRALVCLATPPPPRRASGEV